MILTEEEMAEFEELSRPLIEWLNETCHPHVIVQIEPGRTSLSEGVVSIPVDDYIKD